MDKFKDVAQRLGIITVEDMERYTSLELIVMIANKMNEFQETINVQNDKIHYLLNEGTLSEIEQIFNEWLQDGTFDTLINESALKKVSDRVDENSAQLSHIAIDVLKYGAKGDGKTDDSEAIQKVIDDLPTDNNLKTIVFPQGYVFKCNVEVNKPNLVLTGGGTITGNLLINVTNSYANLHIKDLSFKDGGCVEYRACAGGSISRCTFQDTSIAIKMKASEGQTGQSIARLKIEHNSFENTNYNLLCKSIENNNISIADIHFINNMCKWAKVSHIDIDTMDGAIISGNTFFCNRIAETYHHIIVREWSNWFIVNNNNLFESGHESIYLKESENYNISNNNFAWTGRYVRCSAIKIEGLTKGHQSYGSINGNNINVPSNTGVEVVNSSYINIKNNNIALAENQNGFKGGESVNLEKFYGVYTDNVSKAISVDNLVNKINRHRNPSSVHFRLNKFDFVELKSTTSIDGNYDEVRLTEDSTIEQITNGFVGQTIRIYVLANYVTIKNNSTIYLKGNVDAKLKRRDMIELVYKDGVWIEKNRNEMNKGNVKSLKHSDNSTLDVSNDENIVVLNNTIDVPISEIKGSYDGQQVTIISNGAINKIEHNGNLKNKDADTVLIPNGRSITFINYHNVWYEAGRSF